MTTRGDSRRFSSRRGWEHRALPSRSLQMVLDHWLQAGVVFYNAFGDRVTGQPGNVVNPQLVHHLLPMFFDSLNADAKLGGDLFVGPALGNELQHLSLTRRQIIRTAFQRLAAEGLSALIAQSFGNRWTEEGNAFERLA